MLLSSLTNFNSMTADFIYLFGSHITIGPSEIPFKPLYLIFLTLSWPERNGEFLL